MRKIVFKKNTKGAIIINDIPKAFRIDMDFFSFKEEDIPDSKMFFGFLNSKRVTVVEIGDTVKDRAKWEKYLVIDTSFKEIKTAEEKIILDKNIIKEKEEKKKEDKRKVEEKKNQEKKAKEEKEKSKKKPKILKDTDIINKVQL